MMREVRKEALESDSGAQPLIAGAPGGQKAWALRGHTTWLGLLVGSKRLTLPLLHPHIVLGRTKPINQPIHWPKTEPTLLCGGQAEGREERRKHFRMFLFSVLKSFLFKTKINCWKQWLLFILKENYPWKYMVNISQVIFLAEEVHCSLCSHFSLKAMWWEFEGREWTLAPSYHMV